MALIKSTVGMESPQTRGSRPIGLKGRFSVLIGALVISGLLCSIGASSASALPAQFFGLNFSRLTSDPGEWEAIGHSGAQVLRMNAQWSAINTAAEAQGKTWRDAVGWEETYDRYIEQAAKNNVTILADFYDRKQGPNERQFYESSDPKRAEWLEFVWTFVQRYGYGGTFWAAHPSLPYRPIRVWEVWNEPNLKLNNPGGEAVSPKQYAEFFVATANTIRGAQNAVRGAGDPNDTRVLVGGINQTAGANPNAVPNYFAKIESESKAVSNQFQAAYDGVGIHPYSFIGNKATKLAGVQSNIKIDREAITKYGGAGKTIWVTELGWAVEGEGLAAGEPAVGEQEQAELLKEALGWLGGVAEGDNIKYADWYFYRDLAISSWDYHCGLRALSGRYRASWFAFQALTGAPTWPVVKPPKPANLVAVAMNHTGGHQTGVHVLGSSTQFQSWLVQRETPLAETSPAEWQWTMGDVNGDGIADLVGVDMNHTAGHHTDVHVLDGATQFQTWLVQRETPLGETTAAEWQWTMGDVNGDGIADLVGVDMNHTGGHQTGIHVLDGATQFQTWLIQQETPLGETSPSEWQWTMGDTNGDGIADLVGVDMNHTAGHHTDIHVLDGASQFQSWLVQRETPVGETTAAEWQWTMGDTNGDGIADLIGVDMNHTGGHQTGVHVLSGVGQFQNWLVQRETPLGETSPAEWEFVAGP